MPNAKNNIYWLDRQLGLGYDSKNLLTVAIRSDTWIIQLKDQVVRKVTYAAFYCQ